MDTAARRLSPLDSTFLELEQADEAATMHIGAALIFDQVPETGGAPTFDALHELISRMVFAPRLFNLTITTVPGPQLPLYALGARMRELIPLAPLFADHALAMAIVSYDGGLVFRLNADRAATPDLPVLEAALREEFSRLRELAPIDAHPPEAPCRAP
jgi:diacylglycerol O-acyltransferase / wax synthase